MLLRNRLSIFSCVCLLIVSVSLYWAFSYRENLLQIEFGRSAALQQNSLWGKVMDGAVLSLSDKIWLLREDSDLKSALAQNDSQAIHAAGRKITQTAITENGFFDRIEVYQPDGQLAYTSEASYFPSPLLNNDQTFLLANGVRKRFTGAAVTRNRQTFVAIAFPLPETASPQPVAVAAIRVERLLDELAELQESETYLINRRGRYLTGEDRNLWQEIGGLIEYGTSTEERIRSNDRMFGVTSNPVIGFTDQVGYIVSVQDMSQNFNSFAQFERLVFAGAIVFLIVAAFGLWFYIRRSLNPLEGVIGVLAGVSQGDFSRPLERSHSNDEVGQISTAIVKLRNDLMRLDRMTRSRRNRSQRQARVIRDQMTELAETLDEDARNEILGDLSRIEDRLQNKSSDSESEDVKAASELAVVTLTLASLKERIHQQHGTLQSTIGELEEALKSKTAYLSLQQELDIARRVQLAMLPDAMPPSAQLDIVGQMAPAKDVGGDFYDFFYLDENRLAVIVADVSGKGVPAALFMAITRSIMRAIAPRFTSPSDCIAALNDALCQNNSEDLFVTLFYGILDLENGDVTYCNAGHNPPYYLPADDHKSIAVAGTGDMALGVMEGLDYSNAKLQLHDRDRFFLYTDGVNEAINTDQEEFGTKRLEEVLSHPFTTVGAVQEGVVSAVYHFADSAPQADDITCVTFEYRTRNR
ncbi:SpoIIE family protein phosphatase [Thalassospira sp. MA62]|nr:SpoIIE family protein phosphatase [Thalassospira sp. MA62]